MKPRIFAALLTLCSVIAVQANAATMIFNPVDLGGVKQNDPLSLLHDRSSHYFETDGVGRNFLLFDLGALQGQAVAAELRMTLPTPTFQTSLLYSIENPGPLLGTSGFVTDPAAHTDLGDGTFLGALSIFGTPAASSLTSGALSLINTGGIFGIGLVGGFDGVPTPYASLAEAVNSIELRVETVPVPVPLPAGAALLLLGLAGLAGLRRSQPATRA